MNCCTLKLGALSCALTVVLFAPTATADKPRATIEGGDLLIHSQRPQTRVRILDERERVVASGLTDGAGFVRLRRQGRADPMLRLIEIGKRRRALSDLLPPVELLAVFPKTLSAGLPVVPHVRVVGRRGGKPHAGVRVEASLHCTREGKKSKRVFQLGRAVSDSTGAAVPVAPWMVPTRAEGSCRIVARGAGATVAGDVQVHRGVNVVVSSDRPVYQPGHVVHARGLATDAATGRPVARAKAAFELRGPGGAVLGRKRVRTSRFGVANATLEVPPGVLAEALQIRYEVGGRWTEKRVKIGSYVPQKLSVEARTLAPSYRLGETLQLSVRVSRLDNGPVDGTAVEVVGTNPADGADVFTLRGKVDRAGHATFHRKLPMKLAGLELSVRGETPGGEAGTARVPVALDDGRVDVYVIPESGSVAPGLDNGLWVVSLLPGGAPTAARVVLQAGGRTITMKTGDDGIGWASMRVPARAKTLTAKATAGARRGKRVVSAVQTGGVLLKLGASVLDPGGTLSAEYLAGRGTGVAVFDLVQGEHAVGSRVVALRGGKARASFTLPSSVAGTLRLHAWHIDAKGTVRGDTRVLFARDGRDLTITLTPDKETYRPRDEATVNIRVTDALGKPVIAALGLVAIDEGLRALGVEQPGVEQAVTRLGEHWTSTSVALPEWSRQALLMAGDRRRLGVLAAAAEASVALQAPRETGAGRLAAAAKAFEPALQRRADRIAKALTRYYRPRARKGSPVGLKTLLRTRLVGKREANDPWGRRVRIAIDDACCTYRVTVRSAGVDGRWRTGDEVAVSAEFTGYTEYLCACGTGAGGGGFAHAAFGRMGSKAMGFIRAMQSPLKMRTEFPDTLAVAEQILTDRRGRARWTIRLADSLTRWLVQARAVSLGGGLGGAETLLQVDQPFSVAMSLPPTLTRGDRMLIPVSVTNRTDEPRTVTVQAKVGGSLSGALTELADVPARSTRALRLEVRAEAVGDGTIQLTATDGKVSDGARRRLRVESDGVPRSAVGAGLLRAGRHTLASVAVPAGGIPGTRKVSLRVYPSAVGTVVEGLDALLGMPSGCFEQTSSTTYPNALVLDYLKKTAQNNPKLSARAKSFLTAGWKRLVGYEVTGGGFSWFGEAPANKILTAYGVMEFERIALVKTVDPRVAARTRTWLLKQRRDDGGWDPDKAYLHRSTWSKIQGADLPVTAYITWALARGGAQKDLAPSLRFLRERVDQAKDPYVCALVALALSTAAPKHPASVRARERLVGMSKLDDSGRHWPTKMATATYSAGTYGGIETTGLAALALLAGDDHAPVLEKAVSWLLSKRSPGGGWGTTQATVLALEVLLEQSARSGKPAIGEVAIRIGDRTVKTLTLTRDDNDVVREVTLPATPGNLEVGVELTGKGALSYQLAATHRVPAADAPTVDAPLSLTVTPDRTAVKIGDVVVTQVRLEAGSALVRMPTVSLGIPAGFEVDPKTIRAAGLAKAEVLGRRLVLYLAKLEAGEVLDVRVRLTARREGTLKAGLASAWPYYEPDRAVYLEQAAFTVTAAAAP